MSLPGRIERFSTEPAKATGPYMLARLGHELVREFMGRVSGAVAEHRSLGNRLRDRAAQAPRSRSVRGGPRCGGAVQAGGADAGLSADGERVPQVEALGLRLAELAATESGGPMPVSAAEQLRARLPDMVWRELQYRGLLTRMMCSVAMRLIAWIGLY